MSEPAEFRADTRAWLEENCPPGARGDGVVPWGSRKVALPADCRVWLDNMAAKGWTVPTWPTAYGGAALDSAQYLILLEELQRINARSPLIGRGVNYIGPTILEFGTDEQKARWLPGMARGDGGWCMGYSEPGAGSDLASLSMKAERQGDQYIINGRKTWTSDAMHGDYIFALVRTDNTVAKHDGISLILIDMEQPGVNVRPIRLISGNSPFNETLFENARASASDIIGPVNGGWTVGKRLLQYERSTHAGINISGTQGRVADTSLPEIVSRLLPTDKSSGRILDNDHRAALLDWQMRQRIYEITQRRAIEETQARAPGFTSSVLKLIGTRLKQERDELHLAALGFNGLGWESEEIPKEALKHTRTWLQNKSLTIAGGTAEIQLNIIAKRVLCLPD
ncbi:MAG: alkylation response protein AidB-like acyl-CoA dehydrogenase [Candidatus Azotimanducaceae bacterium]|jgi:alkylation response protein AidB-like acyl-CoA dehydrogenase